MNIAVERYLLQHGYNMGLNILQKPDKKYFGKIGTFENDNRAVVELPWTFLWKHHYYFPFRVRRGKSDGLDYIWDENGCDQFKESGEILFA